MHLLRFLLSCVFLLSATTTPAQTIVRIVDASATQDFAMISNIDLEYYPGFMDTVHFKSDGSIEQLYNLKQPAFLSVSINNKSKKFLIEPGMIYQIGFNPDEKLPFSFIEPATPAQVMLDSLPTNFSVLGINDRFPDSIPMETIQDSLWHLLQNEITLIDEAANSGAVSKHAYQLLKLERETYYTTILFAEYNHKIYLLKDKDDRDFISNTAAIRNSLMANNPDDENLMRTSNWFWLTFHYLKLKDFIENNFTNPQYPNLGYFAVSSDRAHRYLSGKALEYFWAANLLWWNLNKDFSPEILKETTAFLHQFSNSKYTNYLRNIEQTIHDFNTAASRDFSPRIQFVKKPNKIKTWKALQKKLKGDKWYVMVWATWCGPCKKEFAHLKKLEPSLHEKGYRILFITVDKEEKKDFWKNMVRYYDLSGDHLFCSSALNQELRRIRNEPVFYIPWFFILNENSEIKFLNAAEPSAPQKLLKQL